VIQRTWMFKIGGKQVVSTVTTMVCFEKTQETTVCQFYNTIPTALFPTESNRQILIARYKEFTELAGNLHRKYRKMYIEERIKKVHSECKLENGSVNDLVSLSNCSDLNDDSVFHYTRVASQKKNCKVIDIECLEENPNSYRAVSAVLDKILQYINESPKERNYLPVYMDGAPFAICMKLIREQYICGSCGSEINVNSKASHVQETHSSVEPAWNRKYKKILIRPGKS